MINKTIRIIFLIGIIMSFISFAASLETSYGENIETENYIISRDKVERIISYGDLFEDDIQIKNLNERELSATFSVSGDATDLIDFIKFVLEIGPLGEDYANFYIKGGKLGNFTGEITITGDIIEAIPVSIIVEESPLNPLFLIDTIPLKKSFELNKDLKFKLGVNKLKKNSLDGINFSYFMVSGEEKYLLGNEVRNVTSSFNEIKSFDFPKEIDTGEYILKVVAEYNNEEIVSTNLFLIKRSFFHIILFGFLPVWFLFLILFFVLLVLFIFLLIRRKIKKSKKYKMELDFKKLPKKSKETLTLGIVAETKVGAYLEPERLKTHTIVAGATGGGKSISAQVIVEEVLMKNVAVIVFDPTAQWSGMLRKCEDKKMMLYYPKFGLKKKDVRAFSGNIRQVSDAREIIEIQKYINPGQIQIFTLNKLDPKDIDIFIANVIRQIFKSDPKETPDLKVLFVFDEVHRLLSKFGGSGEGFLQIERACREFRKWGMGVMLVSQVLSDFVGEIKANISTEVQMRTRDEGDLGRIKTKYGELFLQSLVKASAGVGMFVNPAHNKAKPYFINFRPILHNTRRLSDEELEKYNKYNEIVDDMEYQIEQLEKIKIDVFDLKMEIKLIKDKVMTGNFSVVDIYIEGLKPRLEKQWQKLGKKPKKLVRKLADLSEIKKSVEEAKKAREKFEKEQSDKKKKLSENESAQKPPKEKIEDKLVKAFTFDNGIMVSSLKEMNDVLPNMDLEIFKLHVNPKKNQIGVWIEQISPDLAAKIKKEQDKAKIGNLIDEFIKKSSPKTEEKKEEKK